MCNFSTDKLSTLLEALDAWEKQASSRAMTSSLLSAIFIKDKDEAKAAMEESTAEATAETKTRERRAVLLKAKLIQMQDELTEAALFKVSTPDSTKA